jgi:hypothetical protein
VTLTNLDPELVDELVEAISIEFGTKDKRMVKY